jgi:hypothetical protein
MRARRLGECTRQTDSPAILAAAALKEMSARKNLQKPASC